MTDAVWIDREANFRREVSDDLRRRASNLRRYPFENPTTREAAALAANAIENAAAEIARLVSPRSEVAA